MTQLSHTCSSQGLRGEATLSCKAKNLFGVVIVSIFLSLLNKTRIRLLLTLPHYYWVQTATISCLDNPHNLLTGLSVSPQSVFNTEARGTVLIPWC